MNGLKEEFVNQRIISCLLPICLAFLTACSKDSDKKPPEPEPKSSWFGLFSMDEQPNAAAKLRILTAAGEPIAKAQVLIGSAKNKPFTGNLLTADDSGTLTAPGAWVDEQPVTISAPGFVRVTYFNQKPQDKNFQLRYADGGTQFELKGQTTGYQIKNGDDLVDFSLLMPIVKKQDLFTFDVGMLISPETDTISIYGNTINLPSNVSLPKQKENYGLFSVTLDKPIYRMYFPAKGNKRVMGIRGQFPFNKVVDQMQNGGSMLSVVNDFKIMGGSLKDVSISLPTQNQDIAVTDLSFSQTRTIKMSDFPADQVAMVIPLSLYQGEMVPTDIKTMAPRSSMNLTVNSGSSLVLVVVKRKNEMNNLASGVGQLSASILPFAANITPEVMALTPGPRVVNEREFTIDTPRAVGPDAAAQGFYAVLSNVVTDSQSKENVSRQWEVYSNVWLNHVQLPTWPSKEEQSGEQTAERFEDPTAEGKPNKKRWEVSFLSSILARDVEMGPTMFEDMSYATHTFTDF